MIFDGLIACICEGGAERTILEILLDNNLLLFSYKELLEQEIIRIRSAKEFEKKYLRKGFTEKITVIRVLDSRREKFELSKAYKDKVNVVNVITAPEIEMLIILKESKYNNYIKVKSTMKPSEFCKQVLHFSSVKSPTFIKDYFKNADDLVKAINMYKHISLVHSDELCLSDLLK